MIPHKIRKVERGKETDMWISIMPYIVNETSLSKGEFGDSVQMRYGLELLDFPKNATDADQKFW